MRRILAFSVVLFPLVFVLAAPAQQQGSNPATAAVTIDNDFVHKTFGAEFTFVPEIPATVGDLDGDGIEDVVIAAKGKNPFIDQADKNYTVLDPYHSFYGLGDPKITTKFGENDDPKYWGLSLLVIHGAGPQAWRSDSPKSKFVLINVPFTRMSVKRIKVKKKVQMAVYAQDSTTQSESGAVYFDGKKYRYQPLGTSMDN
jgi:hypothetical protein